MKRCNQTGQTSDVGHSHTHLAGVASVIVVLTLVALCCQNHPPAGPLPGNSIYQLRGAFTDDAGHPAPLAQFRGRKVILAMIYTNCVYVCPRIVADMKRLQKQLAERGGPAVHFVAISFDAERDSPAVLRKYRKRMKLDEQWTLLAGSTDDVRETAAALGLSYTKLESGDFSHTIAITILDENGVILHKQEGNTGDTAALLARIAPAHSF